MLGSRTKQINAYGKRGRRVVDATTYDIPPVASTEIISIFDDLPPPQRKSQLSNLKRRENTIPSKPKSVVPIKIVGLQRKKRLSPVLSPPTKKQVGRVAQLIGEEILQPKVTRGLAKGKSKPLGSGKAEDPIVLSTSPRAPLSAVAINIPGSPAISHRRPVLSKAITFQPKKPFSPFVDVDIIVIDDEGRTLRTERRISRTDVDANPFNQRVKHSKKPTKPVSPPEDTDSDVDLITPPRRPRRTRRKPIVLSETSESEDEYVPQESLEGPATNSGTLRPPLLLPQAPAANSRKVLEVVIPPAPYKLPRFPAPSAPSPPVQVRPLSPLPQITRYQSISPPPQKPRQLTPIRGRRKPLFAPPSPPSPTTPTDFDLSVDFSDLSLGSASQTQGTYQSDFEVPDSLLPLLNECGQEICGPHNFSTFIESFPCDPILHHARQNDLMDVKFRKIGEASYSEVFGIGDVVLKVIPLRDETRSEVYQDEEDGPAPSDAKDVRKEIIVTRAMGDVHDGFVKLLKTYVVRGRYPEVLLQLWDEYNERKGSESVRPDTFKVSQIYAIIVLPNGGPDLEAYTFHNASRVGWRQACSLFWQVTKALAHAEHLVSFEHRDLHWGQILVKATPGHGMALKAQNLNQNSKSKFHRVYMDDLSHGVQATIIDLGLSRMDAGDGGTGAQVHWTPFDAEVFMGEGDYQFDIYRMMKEITGEKWADFHPMTNVFWLHYLLQKLIHSKSIKPPSVSRKAKGLSEIPLPASNEGSFTEKDCYDCLLDIESWLGKAIEGIIPVPPKGPVKGKGKRKIKAPVEASAFLGPMRAGEVVAYGAKKGWIKPTSLT